MSARGVATTTTVHSRRVVKLLLQPLLSSKARSEDLYNALCFSQFFIPPFFRKRSTAKMPPRVAQGIAPVGQGSNVERELRAFGNDGWGWFYWSLYMIWCCISFVLKAFPSLDAAIEVTGRYALVYVCVLITEYIA
jgi:hypothetical protein